MKPLAECRLYAFVDTTCLRGRAPDVVARQLCDGGADLIQLRAKQSPLEEVRRMAEAIVPVTRAAGVGLVINDYPGIAREVGAEFYHLGQEDYFGTGGNQSKVRSAKSEVRSPKSEVQSPRSNSDKSRAGFQSPQAGSLGGTLVEALRFGLSSHSPEEAARAVAAGADYLGVGPVYATGTKPDAKPVTLEYVRWAAANVEIPWFAIGGINLSNLDELLEAGARRICVVSAILNAADVAGACREFKQRLG